MAFTSFKAQQNRANVLLKKIIVHASRVSALKKRSASKKPWQVECVFVSKKKITQLNQMYRNKKRPTDILSFSSPKFIIKSQGFLGELVICWPVLKTQAKRYGHSLEAELKVLLIHGFLHLLGFDHERSKKGALLMQKYEKLLLCSNSLGLIERSASGKT